MRSNRDATSIPPPAIAGPAAASEQKDRLRSICGSESPQFNKVLLRQTVSTVWFLSPGPDAQDKHIAAVSAALAAFKPADEIEAMLASQAIAMNCAAMECFRRAMLPDQPGGHASKFRRDGANLARGMTDMLDALDRKRGKGGQQRVTVEHVHVHSGGNAIVGNIGPGAAEGGGEVAGRRADKPHAPPAQLAHDTPLGAVLPPLRRMHPEREAVPSSGDAERPLPHARRRKHGTADG